jgi:hypothetical protein
MGFERSDQQFPSRPAARAAADDATDRLSNEAEVVGGLDETRREGRRFIIADISRDGAWIAMDADASPRLSEWV